MNAHENIRGLRTIVAPIPGLATHGPWILYPPLGLGLGMANTTIDDAFRPVFRWFAVASGVWFIVVGPVLAIVLGLSFAAELLVVVLPAAGFVAIGAYIARPDKFRPSANRTSPFAKTR